MFVLKNNHLMKEDLSLKVDNVKLYKQVRALVKVVSVSDITVEKYFLQ